MPEATAEILNAQDQFDNFRFSTDLAIPGTIDVTKRRAVTLTMQESEVQMGLYETDASGDPVLDADSNPIPLTTTVWGYGEGRNAGYLGPTLLAEEGSPVTINWLSGLPLTGHLLNVDFTLHRANPILKTIEAGFTPVVTHLHGGETRFQFDGYPEAWYTQTQGAKGPAEVGPEYSGTRYTYDNDQVAAPLWYHDHALGLTRLNVYAGLAGVYDLTDDWERELQAGVDNGNTFIDLPDAKIPLVIQDKAFTTAGELYFPALDGDLLPDGNGGSGDVGDETGEFFDLNLHPKNDGAASALPEFAGDHILVNGVAWPNFDVGNGGYTFKLLNGSDSRFYVLDFVEIDENGAMSNTKPDIEVLAIAGDGGFLPSAADVSQGFVLAPGDRLDVVVDFSGLFDANGNVDLDEGHSIRLINKGPDYSPFKAFNNPDDVTSGLYGATAATIDDPVGNVMQFRPDASIAAETVSLEDGDPLWPADDPDYIANQPENALPVRKLGLFEGADEFGRVQPLLGTAKAGALHTDETDPDGNFGPLLWGYMDENGERADVEITENIELGSTEKWEVFNFTADAHPVHLHLTQFQALGRREIQFQDDGDGIPDDTNEDGQITYGYYNSQDDIIFFDDENTYEVEGADIWVSNTLRPMADEELGRQDTVYVPSGEEASGQDGANIGTMLELTATFDKPGLYVWHCHILSHEDHEMMRPFVVEEEANTAFLDDTPLV